MDNTYSDCLWVWEELVGWCCGHFEGFEVDASGGQSGQVDVNCEVKVIAIAIAVKPDKVNKEEGCVGKRLYRL